MSESIDRPGVARSVSVLTPRGRSAVAVVRVAAEPDVFDRPPAAFVAANGRPLSGQPLNRLCYGRWGNDPGEDVVVCRIAPDETEVSCHGGVTAVARIVSDLQARGCRTIDGHGACAEGVLRTECLEALSAAPTLRTAAILLEQSSGLLEQAIEDLLAAPGSELTSRLDDLLRWAEFGLHLTRPWRVALIGVPNVGKSSLMNALLGYGRSIVDSEPGTTRDVVTAVTAFEGWPVELSDTAGLRHAAGEIEAAGVGRARRQAAAADLSIIVLDRSRPITDDERQLIAAASRALIVANKADLPSGWPDSRPGDAIPVSSLTGSGVEELAPRIASALIPVTPSPGTAIPVTLRQVECLSTARHAAIAGDVESARAWLGGIRDSRLQIRPVPRSTVD